MARPPRNCSRRWRGWWPAGVTHVAMENTGVYWKPLYNLLEATGLTVFVVNAAHMKAVPGRMTDIQDGAPRRANRPWVRDPPWQLPSSAR
jgi:transposase